MKDIPELKIIPADPIPADLKINFIVKEYIGAEIYLLDENNKPIEKDLCNKEDLHPGLKIYCPTLFGAIMGIVQEDCQSALSESGGTLCALEFDIDDRHCWTTSVAYNTKLFNK